MSHWDAMGLAVLTACLTVASLILTALFGADGVGNATQKKPAHGHAWMVALFALLTVLFLLASWVAIVNAPK